MTSSIFEAYRNRFVPAIPRTPTNRFASIIMLRETKSYAIFTTEGGEQQDVEQTSSGLTNTNSMTRLVMFKRKQVAPERRTGKALLRQYAIFPYVITKKGEVIFGDEATKDKNHYDDCYLTEGLCTHCPDCLIYGYAAVEGEGARKARLMTDTCFSVRPYEIIQKQVKFNVISEATHTSGTITEYDYTVPGIFMPSVETTVDLTADEFTYVLGNVLRTARYGKEGTRQGFMRNHILAIAFSDVELFANLEFTQAFYDALVADKTVNLAQSLKLSDFQRHTAAVLRSLTSDTAGRLEWLTGDDLTAVLDEVRKLNQDEARLAAFLRDLHLRSATFIV